MANLDVFRYGRARNFLDVFLIVRRCCLVKGLLRHPASCCVGCPKSKARIKVVGRKDKSGEQTPSYSRGCKKPEASGYRCLSATPWKLVLVIPMLRSMCDPFLFLGSDRLRQNHSNPWLLAYRLANFPKSVPAVVVFEIRRFLHPVVDQSTGWVQSPRAL